MKEAKKTKQNPGLRFPGSGMCAHAKACVRGPAAYVRGPAAYVRIL